MTTRFVSTVKPSGGDFTSLASAVVGLANNLIVSNIKVFSVSTYSSPVILQGNIVTGQSSGATGICVLFNANRTQILIKSIVGTFQSGENVRTADLRTVMLSNSGDSPSRNIFCYSMLDTTPVIIDGYVTSSTNFVDIQAPIDRHSGKWDETKYRLEINQDSVSGITIKVPNVIIHGLQIYMKVTPTTVECSGIEIICSLPNINIIIYKNIIRGVASTNHWFEAIFDRWLSGSGICQVWNNIIYGFSGERGVGINFSVLNSYIYNNTTYNCGTWGGICIEGGTCIAINNLCYNNVLDFNGTFTASNNNFSRDNTAPGANSIHGATDGKTPDFVNIGIGTEDLHIQSTSDAIGVGMTNPGSGLFSDDVDGILREGIWDIGADQFTTICPTISLIFEVS